MELIVLFKECVPLSLFPGQNTELTTESESFWLSATDSSGAQLRYGVNPYNAARAYRVSADGSEEEEVDTQSGGECDADEDGDGDVTGWSCHFQLPFSELMAGSGGPVRLQMLHAHSTVAADEGDEPFYSALCPGAAQGVESGFDWDGCETDPRSVVEM